MDFDFYSSFFSLNYLFSKRQCGVEVNFDLYSSFFSLKYVLSYGGGAIEELFEAGAFLKAHKLIKAAFPDAQIDYRSFSKTVFDQEMFVGCFTMKQKMCVHYNNVLSSY